MQPKISIITVTMNHIHLLTQMLDSLYNQYPPHVSFELIIVDNCSTDQTKDFIQKYYPQVNYIENTKIAGFAENNNKGVTYANGEYILILNPDIIIQQNSIDLLYLYLSKNEQIGIIAPQLLNTDFSIQYSMRKFISPSILFARIFTRGNDQSENSKVKEYLMSERSFSEPTQVDWCLGAALLFRKSFYQQLKGFDENFFLYVEDMDICHRCWKLGKQVVYLPESKMIHAHQRSSTKLNKKTLMHVRSMFYFFWKNRFSIKRSV